jgi:hypothetical protein
MDIGPAKPNDPRMKTADGVTITDGLKVWDYNGEQTTVDLTASRIDRYYWDGWFRTANHGLFNGERLSVRKPY